MFKKSLALLTLVFMGFTTVTASAQGVAQDANAVGSAYVYRLGSGDRVTIKVFGEKDLDGDYVVTGDGKLSLPLIGEVAAAGLTVPELQDRIQTAYKQGFLNDPKVNIQVANFRPFYIMGEVENPGQYPYSDNISVINAVAVAGGFTYRAQQKKVWIRRAGEVRETQVELTSELTVSPGDTIRIGERYF